MVRRFFPFLILLALCALSRPAAAQFTFGTWADTLTVTTSDTTLSFSPAWESFQVWSDSTTFNIKVNNMAVPVRVNDWTSGPQDRVSSCTLSAITGTVKLYIAGIRRGTQPSP